MDVKENLKYTKDHEWVSVEGNIATVGTSDFAQVNLEILFMLKLILWMKHNKDEVFGTVEAVKTVSDLFFLCQVK